jgi:hypothetical protein
MSPEVREEFDRQLKSVQALAKHRRKTIIGLVWDGEHLGATMVSKGDLPPPPAPDAPPEFLLPEPRRRERRRAKAEQLGLL